MPTEIHGTITTLTDSSGNVKFPRTVGNAVDINGQPLDTILMNLKIHEKLIISKSKNLFNSQNVTLGFVDWNTGTINNANTNLVASDFIRVEPNSSYITTKIGHFALYDENKIFIRGYRKTNSPDGDLINTLNNEYYLRISINNDIDAINNFQVEKNTTLSEYEPYGFLVRDAITNEIINSFSTTLLDDNEFIKSRLYGKKVSWYGTSITQGSQWCEIINNYFNFNSTINGVGGTAICNENISSMCTKTRMNGEYSNVTDENTGEVTFTGKAIPSDVDIIFIEGGINDWARNWPIGDKTFSQNPNDQTFAGACHLMFKNLTELFPNAEIIIIGTTFGKLPNRDRFNDKYGILNNENLQSIEYGDVLLDIAGKWGIKGINIGRVCGLNDNNILTVMPDGLHPYSDTAKMLMVNTITSYLLTI